MAASSPRTCWRRRPVPGFTNAAVDGYARRPRLARRGRTRLEVTARSAAGAPARARVARARRRGSSPARPCPKAPTPASCRRTCRVSGGFIRVPPGIRRGANVRKAGEDLQAGRRRGRGGNAAAAAGNRRHRLDGQTEHRLPPAARGWRAVHRRRRSGVRAPSSGRDRSSTPITTCLRGAAAAQPLRGHRHGHRPPMTAAAVRAALRRGRGSRRT